MREVKVAGDQRAQGAAVAVLEPAVGADEREAAVRCEQLEAALEERDVEIGAVVDGGVAAAIFGEQRGGDLLLADVGRVADDDVEVAGERGKEEVVAEQPEVAQGGGVAAGRAPGEQAAVDELAGGSESVLVDLDGADGVGELVGVARGVAGVGEGSEQAVDGGEQEVAGAEGGLEQAVGVERVVGGVSGEVEQGGDDLGAREDGAAVAGALVGEVGEGGPQGGGAGRGGEGGERRWQGGLAGGAW
jgi:hypothetical protein